MINLKEGQTGKVIKINGGKGIHQKLEALGIRPGVQIKRVSSVMLGGPIVVQVGNTKIAIGRGMAEKIVVEIEK